MVQTCDAVQCAACSTFQVQLRGTTKKRWACSLCGEKQSYVRIFASGLAKDLRPLVQQLNMARGTASEQALAENHAASGLGYTNRPHAYPAEEDGAAWQMGGMQTQAGGWQTDPNDPWGGRAPWSHVDAARPAAPLAYGGGFGGWSAAADDAQDDGDIYVTELPPRGVSKANKRKYGDGPNQFKNDPRRQHDYGEQDSWQVANPAFFGATPRPPPRSFRAPHAPLAPHMHQQQQQQQQYNQPQCMAGHEQFVTAGGADVIEEEVWQG